MKGQFVQKGAEEDTNLAYQVPIREGSIIRATLGEIRKKNDDRFFWYRKQQTDFFPDWIGEVDGQPPQGVEDTLELAKMRILQGWRTDD